MNPLDHMQLVLRDTAARTPHDANDIIADHLGDARGVIHVGANIGQERDVYASFDLPVIWIEPLAIAFDVLRQAIAKHPKQQALQYLCTDKDGDLHKFGVSNNECQSSSIFDLGDGHKTMWPHVGFIECVEIESTRLATILFKHRIDLNIYDTLVIDVQGAELLVLKGTEPFIGSPFVTSFRRIIAEAADFDAYVGGCTLADLDGYLLPRGFVREALVPVTGEPDIGTYYEAVYRMGEAAGGVERHA